MTRKRLFALLAVLSLVGFFGVILFFVPRTDLAGVFILGLLLVVYDLWTQLAVPPAQDDVSQQM